MTASDTEHLSTTKDLLLRHARRQLYYSGLYFPYAAQELRAPQKDAGRSSHSVLPLLQDIILFDALDAEQLAALAAGVGLRSLEPGEVLFTQGGTEATLFIVVSGIIQVSQRSEVSRQQTVGSIGSGDYIGEISLLTGAPYAATALARTHCKLYGLDRDVITRLLADNTSLYAEFDRSARRSLAILHRGVAGSATGDSGRQSLLHRIRGFFDDPR